MDFVGEYKTKKKLADALRKRQDAIAGIEAPPATFETRAQGAFPGQVQANWLNPLTQMGTAYFGKKADEKATAAEEEAEAARAAALQQVIAGGSTGENGQPSPQQKYLTPENVLAMQGLGIDASTMKLLKEEKPAAGAITQAASSPAGIRSLVEMGIWTPEQGDRALAALESDTARKTQAEREQFDYEQIHKREAPPRERAETDAEWSQRDPAGWKAYHDILSTSKVAGKTPAGTKYSNKADEKKAEADVKLAGGISGIDLSLKTVAKIVDEQKAKPYTKGKMYRFLDAADQALLGGAFKPSHFDPDVQRLNQRASQFRLDAMDQMRGLGSLTEAEGKVIADTVINPHDDADVILDKLEVMRTQFESAMAKAQKSDKRVKLGVRTLPEDEIPVGDITHGGAPAEANPNETPAQKLARLRASGN